MKKKLIRTGQCCGIGSSWIRICIDLAVLDPDPDRECGSGSMEIEQNILINLVSYFSKMLLYLRMYVFMSYYLPVL
jgi:hypothetical protein